MCNYSVLSFIIELSEGQLPFLMNIFLYHQQADISVLVREQESSFTQNRTDSFMALDHRFTFKQLLWEQRTEVKAMFSPFQ